MGEDDLTEAERERLAFLRSELDRLDAEREPIRLEIKRLLTNARVRKHRAKP